MKHDQDDLFVDCGMCDEGVADLGQSINARGLIQDGTVPPICLRCQSQIAAKDLEQIIERVRELYDAARTATVPDSGHALECRHTTTWAGVETALNRMRTAHFEVDLHMKLATAEFSKVRSELIDRDFGLERSD